jgi:hypothetical protein
MTAHGARITHSYLPIPFPRTSPTTPHLLPHVPLFVGTFINLERHQLLCLGVEGVHVVEVGGEGGDAIGFGGHGGRSGVRRGGEGEGDDEQ